MANKLRGEVEVEIGGKMRRLVYNGNSLAEIETTLNQGVVDRLMEMNNDFSAKRVGRMVSSLRAFLWAGLHAVDGGIKIENVGRTMQTDLDSLKAYLDACSRGIADALGMNEPDTQDKIKKAKEDGIDPLAGAAKEPEAVASISLASDEKHSSAA